MSKDMSKIKKNQGEGYNWGAPTDCYFYMQKKRDMLEREIRQSIKIIQKELNKLYDLNLAPYRGYYDEITGFYKMIDSL